MMTGARALLAFMLVATLGPIARAADKEPTRPPRTKGGYVSLSMSGSEVEAPRPTSTTDLELFRGLGLAVAGGWRTGRVRLEGELHVNRAERLYSGDRVRLTSAMFNAHAHFPLGRRFSFFLGGGVGLADVDVRFETCLDLEGCPADYRIDGGGGAVAYQHMGGITWSIAPQRELLLAYRELRTSDLGLSTASGGSLAEGKLDMPLALLGITWKFAAAGGAQAGAR